MPAEPAVDALSAAARKGEKDKTQHYGMVVLPFAMEPGGRFGQSALQALTTLHRESAEFGRLRLGTSRASALALGRPCADLEAQVARHACTRKHSPRLVQIVAIATEALFTEIVGHAVRE